MTNILNKTDLVLTVNKYLKQVFDGIRKQTKELHDENMQLKLRLERMKENN